jgi:hypothetical protein
VLLLRLQRPAGAAAAGNSRAPRQHRLQVSKELVRAEHKAQEPRIKAELRALPVSKRLVSKRPVSNQEDKARDKISFNKLNRQPAKS